MNCALPLLLATVLVGGTAAAQTCSLTVLGSGQPGTVLRFEVRSNPGDYTAVIVSDQTGPLMLPVPGGGTLALNVLQPWIVIETGVTDVHGFATLNTTLPAAIVPLSLYGQGLTILAPFTTLQLCATNTVPFSIG